MENRIQESFQQKQVSRVESFKNGKTPGAESLQQ